MCYYRVETSYGQLKEGEFGLDIIREVCMMRVVRYQNNRLNLWMPPHCIVLHAQPEQSNLVSYIPACGSRMGPVQTKALNNSTLCTETEFGCDLLYTVL